MGKRRCRKRLVEKGNGRLTGVYGKKHADARQHSGEITGEGIDGIKETAD
jgi:hypothetical protein